MISAEYISKRDAAMEGRHKARVAVWQQMWRRKYMDDINNGQYDSLIDRSDGMSDELTLLIDKYGGSRPDKSVSCFYSVTINPPVTDDYVVDFYKLKTFVEKLQTLKRMPVIIAYAYDQRSSDSTVQYHGVHCHMMVRATDLYISDVQNIVYNCAKGKKQYGPSFNRPAIHVAPCNEEWIEYIKGNKTDDKDGVVECTRAMLSSLDEPIYVRLND